ncbi:MAG: hypothetical protein O4805_13755 [Trichodesmium sp. St16_bin2-tuft]|nr:hypothetical protein [Trichodesmium sp. St16_bin2-tuft]
MVIVLENSGIPISVETVILVGRFLAGSEKLTYWYMLGSAIIETIFGDSCGYWIGKYGGRPLILKLGRTFRIKEAKFMGVKHQFSQNVAKFLV